MTNDTKKSADTSKTAIPMKDAQADKSSPSKGNTGLKKAK